MASPEALKRRLEKTSQMVNEFIEKVLPPNCEAQLYQAARYQVFSGGKRLRPYLTIKSCEAAGGTANDALPLATATEILHNFTLIHDDVMDGDLLRRGKETVHVRFGEPMAILSGDLLFAKVYQLVIDHAPPKMTNEEVLEALGVLTDAAIQLCEGQALDVMFPQVVGVTEEDYFSMVGGKTAALFRACAQLGAMAAGAPREVVDSLGEFAWNSGLAFQIVDDVLGVTADESTLGKPRGSDIRERKKTLLLIHALRTAQGSDLETLKRLFDMESPSQEDVESIIDVMDRLGSIQYAKDKARHYLETALTKLGDLEPSPAKDQLAELVRYFVERGY